MTTPYVLRIETPETDYQVTGTLRLFLVRGDVALIPADLAAAGAGPDPSRWYTERWEEETISSGSPAARSVVPLQTQPSRNATGCWVRSLYR